MGLSIALIHFPVRNRLGKVVNTAITNFDIHDLARAARTFGVERYYIVAPVESQRDFVRRVMNHWFEGPGAELNITRKEALALVRLVRDINEIAEDLREETGGEPIFVATSARQLPNCIGYEALRRRIDTEPRRAFCLVFGTGYGLDEAVTSEVDLTLGPICGPTDWNHLSVRSAVSIILDRLRGKRE
ncbi:MAG: RNA methyltransferase [Candidatus Sumerlaeota bacterium]|nr:RNA methyltransferase [Candidatus Sumerlaeota bacterium]